MSCTAVTCNARSSTHKDLSFFRFPNDDDLKKKWVKSMRRMDPINKHKLWTPSKNSRLCSKHFRDEDFDPTSPFKKKVKPDAIPSIFNLPAHLKKPNRSKRRVLERIPLQPQAEQMTTKSCVISIPAAVSSNLHLLASKKSSESERRNIENVPLVPQIEHITTELPVKGISDDEPSILDLPAHPKKSTENEEMIIQNEPLQLRDQINTAPSIVNFIIGPKTAFDNLIRNHTIVVKNLEENLKKKDAELDNKEKEFSQLQNILAKKEETIARNRNEIKRLQSSNTYIKKQLARLQDTVIELQERNIILEGNI